MSVWYAIPSKRSAAEAQRCIDAWRAQGYHVAVWRDEGDEHVNADMQLSGQYEGYAATVNTLCRFILTHDTDAEWIVTGGDDMFPDQNKRADEIADELTEHFGGTFGVMQPTGDRWGEQHPPHDGTAYSDRVCSSPWMGRDFCARMYGGQGPMHEGYHHMGVDEELQHVAIKLNVFLQRRDLIHLHEHWGRKPGGRPPEFLKEANSPEHWNNYKTMFANRKALGFPGHEPIDSKTACGL